MDTLPEGGVYLQHKEKGADRNTLQVVVTRFNTITAAKLQNNTDKDNNRGTESGHVEHVEGSRGPRFEGAGS